MNHYNPQKHHRRSIRLQGYDYSQEGLYFITICCQDRAHLFGEILDGEMILNDAGLQAQKCWQDIPNHFPNAVLHEYIIMPNHIHGIIEFVGANQYSPNNNSPNQTFSDNGNDVENNDKAKDLELVNGTKNFSPLPNATWRSPSKTIGSVIRGFKIGVTKWMRNNTTVVNVWQRNYYDHIIRNEQDYERISEYIKNNPILWKEDRFYDNGI
ncbi:transposase [Kaistella sp.]|uniref:transposase n=1 Tax=Kaistella sp. TaxID=2782235 RepID=UPI002F924998